MSRLFASSGTNEMIYSLDTSPTAAFTMLIVVKIATTTDTTWQSLLEFHTAPTTHMLAMGRNDSGHIYVATGSTQYYNNANGQIRDEDGWAIVAATKIAGTNIPRIHKMVVGGSAFHNDAGGTIGDPGGPDQVRIGGNDDWADIYVAAAAFWNSALTDGNLDSIHSALTTQSILDLSPAWCVDDAGGDGLATDLVGTNDRDTLVGTTDSADDPPGWVYFGEGGGDVDITGVVAAATAAGPTPDVSGRPYINISVA